MVDGQISCNQLLESRGQSVLVCLHCAQLRDWVVSIYRLSPPRSGLDSRLVVGFGPGECLNLYKSSGECLRAILSYIVDNCTPRCSRAACL